MSILRPLKKYQRRGRDAMILGPVNGYLQPPGTVRVWTVIAGSRTVKSRSFWPLVLGRWSLVLWQKPTLTTSRPFIVGVGQRLLGTLAVGIESERLHVVVSA